MLRARREHVDVEVADPATDGLSDQVARRAELRDLLADVGRLPADQRAALVLAELDAVSHSEIAPASGSASQALATRSPPGANAS